jgi:hypothetical protein
MGMMGMCSFSFRFGGFEELDFLLGIDWLRFLVSFLLPFVLPFFGCWML